MIFNGKALAKKDAGEESDKQHLRTPNVLRRPRRRSGWPLLHLCEHAQVAAEHREQAAAGACENHRQEPHERAGDRELRSEVGRNEEEYIHILPQAESHPA